MGRQCSVSQSRAAERTLVWLAYYTVAHVHKFTYGCVQSRSTARSYSKTLSRARARSYDNLEDTSRKTHAHATQVSQV